MKSTSLFSIIKAKYQPHHYGTEKEKIEYNYLCFRSKNLPCLKFYFLFPGNGKDLKTSLNQKKTKKKNMTEHVFCQDALTQTLCRQGTFSFVGRK